jgi:hypothetical protein
MYQNIFQIKGPKPGLYVAPGSAGPGGSGGPNQTYNGSEDSKVSVAMQNLSAQWVNLTSLGGNIDPFNKGENKKGEYICIYMYLYICTDIFEYVFK